MAPSNRIKQARCEILGVTQRELAIVLDVEPMTVSRWERGLFQPSAIHLRAVAKLADKPVSWFYEEDGASVAA